MKNGQPSLRVLIALALAGATLVAFAPPARAKKHPAPSQPLPIVFVHGGAGSGAQYASVARRFASNGYPPDRIATFEYDSSSPAAIGAAPAQLDVLIDQLRAQYGVERVNLVGHSLGTFVSNNYLGVATRAAKIAHYVGVDGASNPTCGATDPGLECMGIFRGATGDVGGNNIYFNSTQSHVEAATSPESFAAQYEFFIGQAPKTTLILPEPPGQVEIAGRAVDFPQNAGLDGGILRIWRVSSLTGRRSWHPVATIAIGPSGDWGPVRVNGRKSYEFELHRADSPTEQNIYYQPFIRDNYWIRLLSSAPTSGIVLNTTTGPNHAAAVVIRYREWWTTHPSGDEDTLEISTRSPTRGDEPAVDALQNVISDGLAVGASPVGVHVHDYLADQVSSLSLIPFFTTQPFQTGVDVYMPATNPPDGTITFANAPRGDTSRIQVVNTANWASDDHRITVEFNDYVQDIDSWGDCKRVKPSPCQSHGHW
jgi:Lipase C-terminal domain/AF_1763-like, C-terminal domain/alpha/beta hydrolase fold